MLDHSKHLVFVRKHKSATCLRVVNFEGLINTVQGKKPCYIQVNTVLPSQQSPVISRWFHCIIYLLIETIGL